MGIPEARDRLMDIATDLLGLCDYDRKQAAREIEKVVDEEMHRRPAVRRAPKRQAKPTERQIMHVKSLAGLYPDWPYTKIAEGTGLNIGRISEILNPPEK